MNQSDTRVGAFRVLAGQDLTGMEGRLVFLTHDNGVPEVKLPVADSDLALYLLTEEGADGELVTVVPLTAGQNYRVALKGACNPGASLVLADVAAAADAGKLRALPAGAGTYRVLAVAEEKGVDGQALLVRPAMAGLITVPAAPGA